jgi:hypothetical protein
MRSRAVALLFLIILAACDQSPQPVDTTLPPDKAAQPAASKAPPTKAVDTSFPCTGADCRIITPHGWAGIRVGMSVRAAMRASGFALKRPGHYDDFMADEPDRLAACNIHTLIGAPENLTVFVENGVITSLSVGQDEKGKGARFETERGLGLGDTEAAVRRAYPRLRQEPDIYSEPPDKKLFFKEGSHGIKFSIVGGRVVEMSFGGSSINYVEGCL